MHKIHFDYIMALFINTLSYASNLVSWAKKTFGGADRSVTSPSAFFSTDEGTSVDPVCSAVEDVEMEERTSVVRPSTSTSSMALASPATEVLDDVEAPRDMDVEEYHERRLSSLELSCVSSYSLTETHALQTEDVGEESKLCFDSFPTGGIELCLDEQSSIPPAPVIESESGVYTRSGRRSRRPARYGSLPVKRVLRTVGDVPAPPRKRAKLCLDSFSRGEVHRCSGKQRSTSPIFVEKSRPIVYTRSGRRSCPPDHYGEWLYY